MYEKKSPRSLVNLYKLFKDTGFHPLRSRIGQWWTDRQEYKLKDWVQTNWFSTGGVQIGIRRRWTPLRVMLHVVYWYGVNWRSNEGLFNKILVDPGHQPDPVIINIVHQQHFWTTIILFYALGEWVLPKIIYREFSLRQFLSMVIGLVITYTLAYLSCRVVFLYIVNGDFGYVPRYVRVRADYFQQSFWVAYTEPLILWFLWAHTFSYTFEPLLFKMGRDIHAWAHQFVRYERDLADLKARQAALEQENTRKELSLLRSQLHPHFLFNALNNIYALVRRTDKVAGLGVTNLADLIRYTLYRSQARLVTLEEEVSFLTKYIAVEQLRRQDSKQITTQINVDGYETWQLPPLLMISYIENAIKHGLNKLQEGGYISIVLCVQPPWEPRSPDAPVLPTLCFYIDNTMPAFGMNRPVTDTADEHSASEQTGGIGLANTKRRLELLYKPEEWQLIINRRQADSPADPASLGGDSQRLNLLDVFSVQLQIPLVQPVHPLDHQKNRWQSLDPVAGSSRPVPASILNPLT